MVIEVNNAALTKIIEENPLVLVDFYGTHCGPCKIFAPMYEGMSEEIAEAVFVKVNVDEEPGLATQFGVMGVPTVIAVKGGEVIASGTGIPKIMPIMNRLKEGAL
jgi:thioredoxin 1